MTRERSEKAPASSKVRPADDNELERAALWLAERFGFPSPSREAHEARRRPRPATAR